jgi:hypothetical protein
MYLFCVLSVKYCKIVFFFVDFLGISDSYTSVFAAVTIKQLYCTSLDRFYIIQIKNTLYLYIQVMIQTLKKGKTNYGIFVGL